MHRQVITLWAATHKVLTDVDVKELKRVQMEMLDYFDDRYPEIGRELEETKALSDELGERIIETAREFLKKSR